MNCTYCERPIDPERSFRRVQGWEKKGVGQARRGGSDIILREHLDEYACADCVSRLRQGLALEQETML